MLKEMGKGGSAKASGGGRGPKGPAEGMKGMKGVEESRPMVMRSPSGDVEDGLSSGR